MFIGEGRLELSLGAGLYERSVQNPFTAAEERSRILYAPLDLTLGLADNLAVRVGMLGASLDLESTAIDGTVTRPSADGASGFGDVTLRLQLAMTPGHGDDGPVRVRVDAGVSLPTGGLDNPVSGELNLSTGSYDALSGFDVNWNVDGGLSLYTNAELTTVLAQTGEERRVGSRGRVALGARIGLLDGQLGLSAGVSHLRRRPDEQQGIDIVNTGGDWTAAIGSASWAFKGGLSGLSVWVGGAVPLNQDLRAGGTEFQLEDDFNMVGGLAWSAEVWGHDHGDGDGDGDGHGHGHGHGHGDGHGGGDGHGHGHGDGHGDGHGHGHGHGQEQPTSGPASAPTSRPTSAPTSRPASAPTTTSPVAESPRKGDVLTVVSDGSAVDVAAHVVPGRIAVFDFYADWRKPCVRLDAELTARAGGMTDSRSVASASSQGAEAEPVARTPGIHGNLSFVIAARTTIWLLGAIGVAGCLAEDPGGQASATEPDAAVVADSGALDVGSAAPPDTGTATSDDAALADVSSALDAASTSDVAAADVPSIDPVDAGQSIDVPRPADTGPVEPPDLGFEPDVGAEPDVAVEPDPCAVCSPVRPVVMVHGINGAPSNWDVVVERLVEQGWPPEYLVRFEAEDAGWTCNVDNAAAIRDLVEEVRRTTCQPKIDLMAHSMGGLSSRYYMKHLGGSEVVNTYVTLGSMHHGLASPCWAPEWLNVCVWNELCQDRPFIADLNEDPATPGDVWWVSIAGTGDATVPVEASHIEGAENIVIDGAEHDGENGLQQRQDVFDEIARVLAYPCR